jgi:CheY-like chemotaxis protein
MASLLDDLLDVSRITRGALTLRKDYVDLRRLLDEAVETVQPLIDAKHHTLTLERPQTALVLQADPLRLSQVIGNLLTNAAKYTDAGGHIVLGTRLEEQSLIIYVRDSGIGLAPEMLGKVFDMFVQVDPDKERTDGGLGIGLALVRGLVELHGGTVEARSAGRDRGSEFLITFPRSILAESSASAADVVPGEAGGKARYRVLIADDNQDAVEVLTIYLRLAGHEVHVAHGGAQAMELASSVRPEIAILDIGMPGLNGYELARRMRSEAWGARMLLIAVTGWGQDEDKRHAQAAGFDHHVTKPMDPMFLESLFPTRPAWDRLKT